MIQFVDFLTELRKYTDALELGDIGSSFEEIEEKSIELINKADEWYSNRSGNFEVCIDFCANCNRHQTSTWHEGNEYLQ